MNPYYIVDDCIQCKWKSLVTVYDYEPEAEVFVWRCPHCQNLKQLAVVKAAGPDAWCNVKEHDYFTKK